MGKSVSSGSKNEGEAARNTEATKSGNRPPKTATKAEIDSAASKTEGK